MKKVLVITLVLVMAFASSAMAAVSFSGKFTATAEMDSFKVFTEEYTLTPGLSFTIDASGKSSYIIENEVEVIDEETGEVTLEIEEEEVVNWDFTAGINLAGELAYDEDDDTLITGVTTKFALGKYRLGLYDNYFNAWVWGNGNRFVTKSTYFDMISADRDAAGIRARLEVPVMDLATITLDLEPKDNIRAFVDGTVEGFDIGLAYARTNWTDEDAVANTIVAQVGTDVPAGDISVRLEAAAGVNLAEELGLGFGLSVDSDVTEELNVTASVTHANEHWSADALTAENTALTGKATYTEDVFEIIADLGYTIVHTEGEENTNSITLSGKYRMSDALTYANLFHADHWFKNTAPAFGAGVKFVDLAFDNVYADVTSPVVENMVWVKGAAKYASTKIVTASVLGHIVPFDKLTIIPLVELEYDNSGDEAVTTPTVNLKANYKIGASDTLLKFEAERVFATAPTSLLKLSVEVPF